MKISVLIAALAVAAGIQAAELPMVKPEVVGFSSERLQKNTQFTRRSVDEGKHAGFVTLVARHGKIVQFEAVGRYSIDNDKPMDKDALFRIYSMTKPVTAVALMMLYEEDAFQMHDRVSKYLPELVNLKRYKDGAITAEGVDADPDSPMKQLLGNSITYRIAVGPQQGRKVFTLQTGQPPRRTRWAR